MSTSTPATHLGFSPRTAFRRCARTSAICSAIFKGARRFIVSSGSFLSRYATGVSSRSAPAADTTRSIPPASGPRDTCSSKAIRPVLRQIKQLFASQSPNGTGQTRIVLSQRRGLAARACVRFRVLRGTALRCAESRASPRQARQRDERRRRSDDYLRRSPLAFPGDAPARIRAARWSSRAIDLDEKVREILPMMEPHLATLPGMSRRRDDWVIDNLIHPGSIIPLINFPEAVALPLGRFDYLRLVASFHHRLALVQVDRRRRLGVQRAARSSSSGPRRTTCSTTARVLPPRSRWTPTEALRSLHSGARAARNVRAPATTSVHGGFPQVCCGKITEDAATFSHDVAEALAEVGKLHRTGATERRGLCRRGREIRRLFGRGQQYISLTRMN